MNPKTVYQLFKNHPKRWVQGVMARDRRGRSVSPGTKSAVSWCLVGAVHKVYGGRAGRVYEMMGKLAILAPDTLTYFNDTKPFRSVVALVKKAGV